MASKLLISEEKRKIFFDINPGRKRVTKKSLLKSGFKEGYKVWIMPDDIILDEDPRA